MPSPKKIPVKNLTVYYRGKTNQLRSDAYVSIGFDPLKTTDHPLKKKYTAIWDTGATNSLITKKVVKECNLKPIDMTVVKQAKGTYTSNVYLVNIALQHGVEFVNFRVTEGGEIHDCDVLIGMDIITLGDFAVTNKNRQTIFSFRVPSIEYIDFVKQIKNKPIKASKVPYKRAKPKVGRNEPCPCGSGKKYKNCCGKSK